MPKPNLLTTEQTREIRECVKAIVKTAMVERGVIEALLEELNGNQSAAADIGGLNRATVRTIIRRNQIGGAQ